MKITSYHCQKLIEVRRLSGDDGEHLILPETLEITPCETQSHTDEQNHQAAAD
jgi:hypothetical protein